MGRVPEYNLSRVRSATRKIRLERCLSKPLSTITQRASGALLGLAVGRSLAQGRGPDGTLDLTLALADELAAGRRDLRALAQRWVVRFRDDPRDIDSETSAALTHLARHDAPPSRAAGVGSDPLVRAVPLALAFHDSPRTLVSATYHIIALTHPDPLVAWAGVAVNVAIATFLAGKRDFVPEVIDVLRGNDVPASLLAATRRVPLPVRAPEPAAATTDDEGGDPAPGRALPDVQAAFRLAYHEPLLERGLSGYASAGAGSAARAALAGALLGARDGVAVIPSAWTNSVDRPILVGLATRLASRAGATT
jgi:ADP-ribosylglycohydrolase